MTLSVQSGDTIKIIINNVVNTYLIIYVLIIVIIWQKKKTIKCHHYSETRIFVFRNKTKSVLNHTCIYLYVCI